MAFANALYLLNEYVLPAATTKWIYPSICNYSFDDTFAIMIAINLIWTIVQSIYRYKSNGF